MKGYQVIAIAVICGACTINDPSPVKFPSPPDSSQPSTHTASFDPTPIKSSTNTLVEITETQEAAPTLPYAASSQTPSDLLLTDLLRGNIGCELPCWWGILPGKTLWSDAKAFLLSLGARIVTENPEETVIIEGVERQIAASVVHYDIPGPEKVGGLSMAIENGKVSRILITRESTPWRFTLPQLLRDYGSPSMVQIRTIGYNSPAGYPPFDLLLFYDEGFMAHYQFEGILEDDGTLGCAGETAPHIRVWSESEIWSQAGIERVVLGAPPTHPLKLLEDVSDLDSSSFTALFLENPEACIRTPAIHW
jgi:hypothetical protein